MKTGKKLIIKPSEDITILRLSTILSVWLGTLSELATGVPIVLWCIAAFPEAILNIKTQRRETTPITNN